MIIVYASLTNNIRTFVSNIEQYPVYHIDDYRPEFGKYVLITYTFGFGEIPVEVQKFLFTHGKNILGVAASGDKNWGKNYCQSADKISELYNTPILHKFEKRGTPEDLQILLERIGKIEFY